MILFTSPRRGKPPGYVSATDLAVFSLCPYQFIQRRVFGIKSNARIRNGQRAHLRRYINVSERAQRLTLGQAILLAQRGEHLMGAEIEVVGAGIYGVMDAVEIGPNGITVVEYKHSLYPGARIQALAYSLPLSRITEMRITVSVRQTENDRVLWEKVVDRWDLEFVERLRDRFLQTVKRGVFPASPGEHCALCTFSGACPFKNTNGDGNNGGEGGR